MAIQLRVTERSIANRVLLNLQGNLSRVGNIQEQLSSGKQINRPSDSPTGTVSAMQLRGDVRSAQQHTRAAEDGLAWLSMLDRTLTSSLDQINRVRDLTLQGASAGTGGSVDARAALATEVENIRESLISLANTRYLDRPIFGGTTTGTTAYDSDGAYVGDAGQVLRTVGNSSKVRVDLSGPEAFAREGTDMFAVLAGVAEDLRNNPAGLPDRLNQLDAVLKGVKTAVADVGARYNRVEHMRDTANDRLLTLRTQLSDIEDIDLPYTIMQMQLQQTAYQAALSATAKVIQPSLIDFLR